MIIESTSFIKTKRPTRAGNIVGAGVAFENGWQAAVGVKMGREYINGNEDKESDCESKAEASRHDAPLISTGMQG